MKTFATALCTAFWVMFSVFIWVIDDGSSFWVAEGILSVVILVFWIGIVGMGSDDDDDNSSGGNAPLQMTTAALVTVII